jgi:DNA-binding transcriptional MocR family regulator
MDNQGLLPAALDAMLTQRSAAGLALPRLLYSIPTGQNPTGAIMGPERMRQVYELARKWGLIILEDDAYFWLQYPQGAEAVPGLNLRREWQLGAAAGCAVYAVLLLFSATQIANAVHSLCSLVVPITRCCTALCIDKR